MTREEFSDKYYREKEYRRKNRKLDRLWYDLRYHYESSDYYKKYIINKNENQDIPHKVDLLFILFLWTLPIVITVGVTKLLELMLGKVDWLEEDDLYTFLIFIGATLITCYLALKRVGMKSYFWRRYCKLKRSISERKLKHGRKVLRKRLGEYVTGVRKGDTFSILEILGLKSAYGYFVPIIQDPILDCLIIEFAWGVYNDIDTEKEKANINNYIKQRSIYSVYRCELRQGRQCPEYDKLHIQALDAYNWLDKHDDDNEDDNDAGLILVAMLLFIPALVLVVIIFVGSISVGVRIDGIGGVFASAGVQFISLFLPMSLFHYLVGKNTRYIFIFRKPIIKYYWKTRHLGRKNSYRLLSSPKMTDDLIYPAKVSAIEYGDDTIDDLIIEYLWNRENRIEEKCTEIMEEIKHVVSNNGWNIPTQEENYQIIAKYIEQKNFFSKGI